MLIRVSCVSDGAVVETVCAEVGQYGGTKTIETAVCAKTRTIALQWDICQPSSLTRPTDVVRMNLYCLGTVF